MSFFDDILIPVSNLQTTSRFDETEQLYVWQYQTEDGTHDLFMDVGEEIRLVKNVTQKNLKKHLIIKFSS